MQIGQAVLTHGGPLPGIMLPMRFEIIGAQAQYTSPNVGIKNG